MNDAEALALILGGLHVLEGVVWVRGGATAFRSGAAGTWRASRPREWSESLRVAPVLLPPLPPFRAAVLCADAPLSPTPGGLLVAAPPAGPAACPPPPRFVRWEDLGEVRADGNRVFAGPRALAVCATQSHAVDVADAVERVRARPAAARPAEIESLVERSLDADAAARAVASWRAATSVLAVSENVLFATLAATVLGLAGVPYLSIALPFSAAAAACAFVFAVLDARRAHTRLRGGAAPERRRLTWSIVVSPFSALRARAALASDLLRGTSPLAAAAALCTGEEFEPLARATLAALRHPPPGGDGREAEEARAWDAALRRARVEAFLRRRGLDPDVLDAPPPPRGPLDRSYCPRCRVRYGIADGVCEDCLGVPLRALCPSV